jgi:hypothetical protein
MGDSAMLIKRIFNLVLVSVMVLSCNVVLAQDSTNAAQGPKIKFAETSYDFGAALQGTQVKHIFKFRNVGTDTLEIAQVQTSCGCTAAESSRIIPPQKEGQIDVTFNTGSRLGKTSKSVYIHSNDVEAPKRSVVIHGTIAAKKAEDGGK